jgi:hypothetical protein
MLGLLGKRPTECLVGPQARAVALERFSPPLLVWGHTFELEFQRG